MKAAKEARKRHPAGGPEMVPAAAAVAAKPKRVRKSA